MEEKTGFAEEFKKAFEEKLKEEYAALDKPNVLVAGRTGVGKSSLINAIFGREIAEVGSGRPVTASYMCYSDKNTLVNIYDSVGWEGGAEKEASFYEDTKKFLSIYQDKELKDKIHIVWYMIDAPGARFTHFDEDLLYKAFMDIPILFVITKSDIASDEQIASLFKAIAEASIPNSIGIVNVAAAPLMRTGKRICEPFGLKEVVNITTTKLPELCKRAFISAQKVELKLKDKESKDSITKFIATAFGVGYIPIPFSDMPILIGLQTTMIARIAVIYGFHPGASLIAAMGGIIAGYIASSIGIFLANMVKILPEFILKFIAGTIEGSIAASITAASGLSFRALFHEIVRRAIVEDDRPVTEEWMTKYVTNLFKQNLNIFKPKQIDADNF